MTKKYNELFHESSSWRKVKLFEKVNITPELAQDLLRLNTENRPLRTKVFEKYCKDLRAGDFQFTGDTIKISKEAVLLDGQHRLQAIAKTGIPMQLHIQSGLNPEVFTVLDTGASRSVGDIMALKHYKYYRNVAMVSKLVEAINNNKHVGLANREGGKTHKDVLLIVESLNKDLLEESCGIGMECRGKKNFIDSNLISALYYVLHEKGRGSKIKEFLELLSSGDGLGSSNNSSIWLLRNRLIENLTSSSKFTLNAKFFLVVTCWNAFIKNKSMKRLPKITEEIPEILY